MLLLKIIQRMNSNTFFAVQIYVHIYKKTNKKVKKCYFPAHFPCICAILGKNNVSYKQ